MESFKTPGRELGIRKGEHYRERSCRSFTSACLCGRSCTSLGECGGVQRLAKLSFADKSAPKCNFGTRKRSDERRVGEPTGILPVGSFAFGEAAISGSFSPGDWAFPPLSLRLFSVRLDLVG